MPLHFFNSQFSIPQAYSIFSAGLTDSNVTISIIERKIFLHGFYLQNDSKRNHSWPNSRSDKTKWQVESQIKF